MKQQFNLSRPEVKTVEGKKQSGFSSFTEKVGALIGIAEGLVGMGIPDKQKKQLTKKQRDTAVKIVIYLILWFIGAGVFETFNLAIKLIKYIF